MKSATIYPMFTWRAALASENGPPNPITRLVLLVLALHMNVKGGSCFPSYDTLAKETGLSRRAVATHIKEAQRLGWIASKPHRVTGQGWARKEYEATIPKAVHEMHLLQNGSASDAKGGAYEGIDAVQEVHPSSSYNSPKNSPILRDEKSEYPFDAWWTLYDLKENRSGCEKKWSALSEADREKAMTHTAAYVLATPDKQYRKGPHSYLHKHVFEDEIIRRGTESQPDIQMRPQNEFAPELSKLPEQSTVGAIV